MAEHCSSGPSRLSNPVDKLSNNACGYNRVMVNLLYRTPKTKK
jgi:hypothetical protein